MSARSQKKRERVYVCVESHTGANYVADETPTDGCLYVLDVNDEEVVLGANTS